MEQNNIYALLALASLIGAVLISKLWIRVSRGDLPGSDFGGFYLRMLLGFLLMATILFGYRAFFT